MEVLVLDKMVDARGLLCPEPVLLTKKAIENQSSGTINVLVDNNAAKENVTRLAKKMGWNVNVTPQENDYLLIILK